MKNLSTMRKISFLLLLFIFHFNGLKAQIIIDNNAPYDNPAWMVDNILLGGGVIGSTVGVNIFKILKGLGQIDIVIQMLFIIFQELRHLIIF